MLHPAPWEKKHLIMCFFTREKEDKRKRGSKREEEAVLESSFLLNSFRGEDVKLKPF
jgi:hypothetical protein